MSDIIHVDDNSFETEVTNAELPVLVDFSATWCGPCQRQFPVLEKFAVEHSSKIKIVKIDIDDAPKVTSKFHIRSVPTLMLFHLGVPVASKVGLTSLAEMNNLVMTKIS